MPTNAEIHNLLLEVIADLRDIRVLWQIGVIGASLAFAWWFERRLAPRLASENRRLHVGIGGLRRIVFPLAALVLVMAGRGILRHWQDIHLLNLAVPLLFSLLGVRLAVYMLRLIFTGSWVGTFERVIAWAIWVWFALYVTGFAHHLTQMLDELAFHVGKQRVSVLLVLQALLSIGTTLIVSLWIGRLIEVRVMGAESVDANVRVMLSKLVRALLVLVAILIALPAVGIDLTMLSVFGGALGVGLGFGLQKIASNYVSGFIILLDRSVTLGDMVTVDNRSGKLTRMTARYVVVRSLDGTEAIIPNETMITSTVINQTHSDRKVRLAIPVQVGYATDLTVAMRVMLEAARAHARVLPEPAPTVLMTAFGDSGINLELGIWLGDPENGTGLLRSELNLAILAAFRAHAIEVPYPQREIRMLQP